MKLIKPNVEIIEQQPGLEGMYKQIELAGRTCFTEDTEVLTDRGFIYIDEIDNNKDRVLTYNPDKNILEYETPNIFSKSYDNDGVECTHANINFLVTEDHRIYQSPVNARQYTFLNAKQLVYGHNPGKRNRFRIPKYFNGAVYKINDFKEHIAYTKKMNGGNREYNTTESFNVNDDILTILAAYITEGHTFHGEKYNSGSYICITQDENNELFELVINALKNEHIHYHIDFDRRKPNIKWIKFGNQCYVEWFEEMCGRYSQNKHLPEWFRNLSVRQIDHFLRILYLGDGSHNKTRINRYLSVSRRLLNEIQELFILKGSNATISYDPEISQKCYIQEHMRDSWIIDSRKHIRTTHLVTTVYCTQTNNGIICIRFNGKTCWIGNCYKSEDKITEDSAKAFVDRMIKSGHGAMLEHGTVYLDLPNSARDFCAVEDYAVNKYSRLVAIEKNGMFHNYVTTNLRVLVENNWLDDLQYICEPTEYHEKRITVKWICDVGVGREFCRHRAMSFAQESTRYCNYSKNRFGNELTFIIPTWYAEDPKNDKECCMNSEFELTCEECEKSYLRVLSWGGKPQEARQYLPFSIKSELVMTGFESDWKHFFSLRSPKAGATGVHPDAAYLADKLYDLLYIEKDYDFSLIHHDAFDGECSFLNDGDMITYHSLHDKNKDSYTIESVTITPKEGEIRTLSREEYLKLTNNTSNESHLSFKAELLDLSESKIKKSKQQISEEPNNILHITSSDGLDLYMHKDEWKAWKEFGQCVDKKEFDNITKK